MICIDSDFIIDFLNGDERAKLIISNYLGELITTEVNVFEIFLGIYGQKNVNKQEEESAKIFFNDVWVLSYGKGCGEYSANLLANLRKNGEIIEQSDCFIASIILVNGCNKIITKNKKHFSRIKEIEIIDY